MLKRLENGFVLVSRAIIGLMMLAMFGMVFTNVVTRYGFGFSIGWAEEVSSFLMIWVTYLGAGLAMREGRHVDAPFPAAQDILRADVGFQIELYHRKLLPIERIRAERVLQLPNSG